VSCPGPSVCAYEACGKPLPPREGRRGRPWAHCNETCSRLARRARAKLAALEEPDETPARRTLAHQLRLAHARELARRSAQPSEHE
jgi:hypothetical protein